MHLFGHRRYNRPNQKWECGRAAEGKACSLGPDSGGKCIIKSECKPVRDANGFQCARPTQLGGQCPTGPLPDGSCCLQIPPCSPRRTTRAKRQLLVLLTAAFSIGLCFYFFGVSSPHRGFLSGGSLSNRHSSIKHQCSSCHATVEGNVINWVLSAKHPNVQSQKCLECHSMSPHVFSPHGVNPTVLAKLTEVRHGDGKPVEPGAKRMECNTCHKEHRGFQADIKTMTNNQCQTCHAKSFKSFANGHPEFDKFPFRRRTRILFDHSSHFGKNFDKAGVKDMRCQTCHAPDSAGQLMVVSGFKQACAQCHSNQIHGVDQLEKGLVFFRVPAVDLKTLKTKGINIGEWPEDADGALTPFQKILIANDDRFSTAFKQVPDVDLTDLGGLSDADLKAVGQVLWGVKSLLADLAGENSKHLQTKLEKYLKHELAPAELALLAGALPPDVLRNTASAWFHNLKAEVGAFHTGRLTATHRFKQPKDLKDTDVDWVTAGGWYRNNGDYTLRYRPIGHADPFIHNWLDVAAASYAESKLSKGLFDSLSSRKANAGSCMKCHSVDAVAGAAGASGGVHVNWHSKSSDNEPKTFDRFRHVSHFSLLGNTGCLTCHSINKDAEYEKAFVGRDNTVFESNFQPIKKATCVACHQSDRAGDSCLSCHNYHVGEVLSSQSSFKKVQTSMDGDEQTAAAPAGAVPVAVATPAPTATPTPTPTPTSVATPVPAPTATPTPKGD